MPRRRETIRKTTCLLMCGRKTSSSRPKSQSGAEGALRKEWQAVKAGINHEGMYIDAVVNGIHLVQLLADTGCLTNAIVSEQFARKAGMTLLDVEPRRLHQVIEERASPSIISQVAKFQMDIYGCLAPAWAYVVPGQEEELILARSWMDAHDARLEPANRLS